MNEAAQRIAPAAIRKSVEVAVPIDRAFEIFASRMGSWWHKEHSLLKERGQADVVIEPRAGGRWYEIAADGTEQDWGRVIEWAPPKRLILAWQLNREFDYDPNFETTVEVNFEERDGGTIVHFEHRDLERMGEGAIETFESMDGGWGMLLDLFKAKAEEG